MSIRDAANRYVRLVLLAPVYAAGCADHTPTAVVEPSISRAGPSALSTTAANSNGVREFSTMSDGELWQYIVKAESSATVGLKHPSRKSGFDPRQDGVTDAPQRGWLVTSAERNVGVASVTRRRGVTLIDADTLTPRIIVHLANREALTAIRRLPVVSYVEPAKLVEDNIFQDLSGCIASQFNGTYWHTASGDILPLTYPMMFIDRAWWYAAGGAGVTVGLTDTGVDPFQEEFSSRFTQGAPGRTISFIGGGNPQSAGCSHGTRLAGVIAAPMNGYSVVGIAWASNLVSAYTSSDLVNSSSSAVNAIRNAGNAGAEIINIAWGTGIAYSAVRDEIDFWHYNHDVVFVGAAGTWSPCVLTNSNNVLFPAEHAPVIAVSVANTNGTRPCSASHGNGVDVVAYHNQPTTGPGNWFATAASVGESSNGSAVVSGVAALIRQRFPHENASQVRHRIEATAGVVCNRGTWHKVINAEAAVGGLCVHGGNIQGSDYVTFIDAGPDASQMQHHGYYMHVSGGSGNYHIQWSSGQTGTSATYPFPRGTYQTSVHATITDLGGGAPPLTLHRLVNVIDACARGGESCHDGDGESGQRAPDSLAGDGSRRR